MCKGKVNTGQTQKLYCHSLYYCLLFSEVLQIYFHLNRNCYYNLNSNNLVAETSHSFLLVVTIP